MDVAPRPKLRPATPLEYLLRWQLHNDLFGDDVTILGVVREARGARLVVSQRHVTGRAPTESEISHWFGRNGFDEFRRLPSLGAYDARAFCRNGIGVFDVRPPNLIVGDGGELVPIDLLLRPLPRAHGRWL